MKQTIISTLLLLLALGCWAQVEKTLAPCVIEAQISDAPNGKTVYLIRKKIDLMVRISLTQNVLKGSSSLQSFLKLKLIPILLQ